MHRKNAGETPTLQNLRPLTNYRKFNLPILSLVKAEGYPRAFPLKLQNSVRPLGLPEFLPTTRRDGDGLKARSAACKMRWSSPASGTLPWAKSFVPPPFPPQGLTASRNNAFMSPDTPSDLAMTIDPFASDPSNATTPASLTRLVAT